MSSRGHETWDTLQIVTSGLTLALDAGTCPRASSRSVVISKQWLGGLPIIWRFINDDK